MGISDRYTQSISHQMASPLPQVEKTAMFITIVSHPSTSQAISSEPQYTIAVIHSKFNKYAYHNTILKPAKEINR